MMKFKYCIPLVCIFAVLVAMLFTGGCVDRDEGIKSQYTWQEVMDDYSVDSDDDGEPDSFKTFEPGDEITVVDEVESYDEWIYYENAMVDGGPLVRDVVFKSSEDDMVLEFWESFGDMDAEPGDRISMTLNITAPEDGEGETIKEMPDGVLEGKFERVYVKEV